MQRGVSITRLVENGAPVLADGGRGERLRRTVPELLDSHIGETALMFSKRGRDLLKETTRRVIEVGKRFGIPLLVGTPTWRATRERLERAGHGCVRDVHGECVRLFSEVREEWGDYADKVFIGGFIACRGDAYEPEEALSFDDAYAYHATQAESLAGAGVDFLWSATMPAASEALGLALAMADTGVPYLMGYVIRPTGKLLDGTPLGEVVADVDTGVSPAPLFHMINCVHPSAAEKALAAKIAWRSGLKGRLLGLQCNASAKTPEELDNLPYLDADPPEVLADHMFRLHKRFGLKVLGGCCGTDERFLADLAARLKASRAGAANEM